MTAEARQDVHVVHAADGTVLAAFSEAAAAQAYAAGRPGRTVATAPLVQGSPVTTTVHTFWVEVDADGVVRSDHDSYTWCPEVDLGDGTPPAAEIEDYRDGPRRRLLCVGTDLPLLEIRLHEALASVALNNENTPLHR